MPEEFEIAINLYDGNLYGRGPFMFNFGKVNVFKALKCYG